MIRKSAFAGIFEKVLCDSLGVLENAPNHKETVST